jgi:hypothetical protein
MPRGRRRSTPPARSELGLAEVECDDGRRSLFEIGHYMTGDGPSWFTVDGMPFAQFDPQGTDPTKSDFCRAITTYHGDVMSKVNGGRRVLRHRQAITLGALQTSGWTEVTQLSPSECLHAAERPTRARSGSVPPHRLLWPERERAGSAEALTPTRTPSQGGVPRLGEMPPGLLQRGLRLLWPPRI